MCRLALLNREAVIFLGSALEYVFGHLENTLGGDGNGVAGLWAERGTTKIRKGVKFTTVQASACVREYARQGADWVLFHTRRATSSTVENRHCHPFRSGRLVLAHNGHDTHFAKLGRAIGISDSECIARTWSRLRFPRAQLATRSGVFIGFARNYPFVVKGQGYSDLIVAWEESSGALLFASELPFWIADGAFDRVIPLGTMQWFCDELDQESLEAHRRRIAPPSSFSSHWGAYTWADDDDDLTADEAAYLEELAYQQELEEEGEQENMNDTSSSFWR